MGGAGTGGHQTHSSRKWLADQRQMHGLHFHRAHLRSDLMMVDGRLREVGLTDWREQQRQPRAIAAGLLHPCLYHLVQGGTRGATKCQRTRVAATTYIHRQQQTEVCRCNKTPKSLCPGSVEPRSQPNPEPPRFPTVARRRMHRTSRQSHQHQEYLYKTGLSCGDAGQTSWQRRYCLARELSPTDDTRSLKWLRQGRQWTNFQEYFQYFRSGIGHKIPE